ncbi:type IV pilus assembly PilZ [Thermodesulfobium narugense DSM 14796]|uniref:Type IV pilus assembly PilZ n=1 Tax=Thermodesulfobium narugense DSM 14796 TaxID=747365 RepID=M1E4L7_9BACT|nr:flagellar brake domain-containing protein [Thermodesulfobium narugense]AEE13661.1 type IV pilus assembly PilZ [Thermodesulfobium narugense DSM 14796]
MPEEIIEKVNNLKEFYKSGTKIDVFLVLRSVGKEELDGPYGSLISFLDDDEVLWIETPMNKGFPLILAPQDLILVNVKKGKLIYQFQSLVLERRKEPNTNLFLFALKAAREVKKIERRKFFRLPVVLDVTIKVKKNAQEKDSLNFKGKTKDLSGGGVKVAVKLTDYSEILKLIKEEYQTFIEFEIDKRKKIYQRIKFVSSYTDEESKIGFIAFYFDNIPRGVQDSIIRFLFAKQREMKQKGIEFDE